MPACPVNGPALSASGRRVAIAWFTMQQEQGHAFVAFSDDAGRTFGKPVRVDDEMSLGRVDVELLPDGSAAASWIEYSAEAKSTSFRVRRIERSGSDVAADHRHVHRLRPDQRLSADGARGQRVALRLDGHGRRAASRHRPRPSYGPRLLLGAQIGRRTAKRWCAKPARKGR